jgi:uncharacterized metal-binding protein YceD (DUF177 family)
VKIHLKQIPPDGLHLEGEESCPIKELETDEMRCAGPLRYNLDIGISDGALWANGSLEQPVELRCVSCLENFLHEIKVPAFALHTELHGPEKVDLTPLVREDLLLNLPAHPHCDRDGGRTCKAAVLPSPAQAEEPNGAAKLEHDWGALDKLKIQKQ